MSNLSKTYFDRAQKVTPGGVHSPVRALQGVDVSPIFFERGEGAWLHSVDGDSYIDFCQSFGPLILGHRDPDVVEAVRESSERAFSLGTCEPYSLELSEWIVERVPWVEKLRFVSSGTEAVMSVLRVARGATGRSKILKFEGCYHGHSDALLVKAGSGLAGISASSSAGVSAEVASTTLLGELDNEAQVEAIFQEHESDIAAVIIEPMPANFGLLLQRKEFLQKVASLAKAHGSLLIFDEVISGFRVAMGGMAEILGIKPDLVSYGKVIGGGFPVGCFGGRGDLMDLLAPEGPVYQAGTLSANPVGMMAGLATLKKIERLDVFTLLAQKTEAFVSELQNRFNSAGAALNVTTFGSLFWIHVPGEKSVIRNIKDIPATQGEAFAALFPQALEAGVYLSPNGYEVNFLSTAHSDGILNQALDALEQAARRSHVQG